LIESWWAKYRKWIVVSLLIYAIFVLLLVLLSGGAQDKPFAYQIF
jgi:hypothetical protein